MEAGHQGYPMIAHGLGGGNQELLDEPGLKFFVASGIQGTTGEAQQLDQWQSSIAAEFRDHGWGNWLRLNGLRCGQWRKLNLRFEFVARLLYWRHRGEIHKY